MTVLTNPDWCDHCHGYGSSLKECDARCTKCGGSGLAADYADTELDIAATNAVGEPVPPDVFPPDPIEVAALHAADEAALALAIKRPCCPACGTPYRVGPGPGGVVVECPECEYTAKVPPREEEQ